MDKVYISCCNFDCDCCSSCHNDAEDYFPKYQLSGREIEKDGLIIDFEHCCIGDQKDDAIIEMGIKQAQE